MQKQGYLTAEQYETAINTPITDGLQSLKGSNSYPPYLDNYLKEVIEQVETEQLQPFNYWNGCLH